MPIEGYRCYVSSTPTAMRSISGLLSGDELSEANILDHLADDLVADFEVLDLELGSLGDEVHLALSFLFIIY